MSFGTWTAEYNGHRIRVENKLARERLILDGQVVAETSGFLRMSTKLKTRLPDSDEEAIAVIYSGGFRIHCSIVIGRELAVVRE